MIDFSDYPALIEAGSIPDIDDAELDAACDVIRGECRWHIAPEVTKTVRLDSHGGRILTLPSLHVVEVTAVTDADDKPITGWELSGVGILARTSHLTWPKGHGNIKVTLKHGLTKTPPALVAVVKDLARSADLAELAHLKSVSLDGASINYGDIGSGNLEVKYGHVLRRFRL